MKRLLLVAGLLLFFSGCGGGWYGGGQGYYDTWGNFQQQLLLDEMIHQQMQTQFELQMMQLQMSPYE